MYNNSLDLLENCQKLIGDYMDVELEDTKELNKVAETFRSYLGSNIKSFSYDTDVKAFNIKSIYFGPEIKVSFTHKELHQIKAVISFTKLYSSISRSVNLQVKVITMVGDEVTYQKMFDVHSPMDLAQAIVSIGLVVGVIIP